MSRRRSTNSPSPADIESLQQQINHFADVINVLRESIDELRDSFEHAVLNGRIQYVHNDPEPPVHLTSMALDPTAKDFQLNTVPPEQLDQLRATAGDDSSPPPASNASSPSESPAKQSHLF